MSRADGKLFEVLADPVCRDLLWGLLESETPLTQSQLGTQLGLSSGLVSKRMGVLEGLGLVERATSHAPYSVIFPVETRALLVDGAQLFASAIKRRAEQAEEVARRLKKQGMEGGHLRDRAREGTR
jgi:DNA-binding transcriptional regulator GbsR (MarR family)